MSNDRAVVPVDSNVFLTFDRLDDDQIVAEMKGAALNAYVYEFSEGGQTVRGLSKTGTDDAARIMAVKYGEALREVDCWLEREDEEAAYFKAKVSRFTIRDDGSAIELDAAIGHKRQPKKQRSGKVNPFWYEQGGQKALRNAKQKLMPETIKQAIIAMYVAAGKVQKVRTEDVNGRPDTAASTRDEPMQETADNRFNPRTRPTPPPAPPIPNPDILPADPAAMQDAFDARVSSMDPPAWAFDVTQVAQRGVQLAQNLRVNGAKDKDRKNIYVALTGLDSSKDMDVKQLAVLFANSGPEGTKRLLALLAWTEAQAQAELV